MGLALPWELVPARATCVASSYLGGSFIWRKYEYPWVRPSNWSISGRLGRSSASSNLDRFGRNVIQIGLASGTPQPARSWRTPRTPASSSSSGRLARSLATFLRRATPPTTRQNAPGCTTTKRRHQAGQSAQAAARTGCAHLRTATAARSPAASISLTT